MAEHSSNIDDRIDALVLAVLRAHAPTRLWVGFSGGVDSTALLLACQSVVVTNFPDLELCALHINHGLQSDAGQWQDHCAQLCAALDVNLVTRQVKVSGEGNLEANARAQRYAAFAECVAAGQLLLLGHHQYDQTETILYRLFSGRGLLPMRASGQVGQGRFARPLLPLGRQQLAAYVQSRGFRWMEDAANADSNYARNFLRHDIVPALVTRWHGLHDALQRIVDTQAGAHDALAHELRMKLGERGDEIAVRDLPEDPPAKIAWLRAYLAANGVFATTDKALAQFSESLAGEGTPQLDCGAQGTLYGYAGHLYFVCRQPTQETIGQVIRANEELRLAGGCLRIVPAPADAPLAMLCDKPFNVRYRRGSERLHVAASGHSKTLKQLFNENKVPPWLRASYPLLFVDEELVCVPGLAVNTQTPAEPQGAAAWVATWTPTA